MLALELRVNISAAANNWNVLHLWMYCTAKQYFFEQPIDKSRRINLEKICQESITVMFFSRDQFMVPSIFCFTIHYKITQKLIKAGDFVGTRLLSQVHCFKTLDVIMSNPKVMWIFPWLRNIQIHHITFIPENYNNLLYIKTAVERKTINAWSDFLHYKYMTLAVATLQ